MVVLHESGLDAGLPWHYGDPLREQRMLASGAGAVDLANREVFSVSGPDRLGWLHSLTSQKLDSLAAGASATAPVLTPQGRLEHGFTGVDDGETFWAYTEPGRADPLVSWLDSMRFMMRVEVARRPELAVVWAPSARGVGHEAAPPEGGVVHLVPRSSVGDVLGDQPAGTWAYDALRIAAGVPRLFVDTDELTLPNEIGLLGTHLDKGCYRGQETVARVHTLGRPPRRLVLLHLDGSRGALPGAGAGIELDGKRVGFVGSSARHHEIGPIALGLIKRAVPVDAALLAGGIDAAQEALVDPDVGLHVRPRL